MLTQCHRRGSCQEDVALQEVGTQHGVIVGTACRGVGGAEEQSTVHLIAGVDDVALYGIVRQMDVVETTHQHLAVATRRLQLSINYGPVAFLITPLGA